MNDLLALALAFVAGALLGAFFFGGLWWTVQKGVASERPAVWFLGSLLLRTAVILAGFYLVSQGHWSTARGMPPWICDRAGPRCEATRTSPGGRAGSLGKGDQHCALVLMNWFSGGTAFSCSIARSSPPGH